jgi:hypothetical protein
MPPASWGDGWELLLETASDTPRPLECGPGEAIQVPERAVLVLRMLHKGD